MSRDTLAATRVALLFAGAYTRPSAAADQPEVTSMCSGSFTWLIAVPRIWRTPSAKELRPWI